jgi:isopenicillin-N N-acyltransferase-like protein
MRNRFFTAVAPLPCFLALLLGAPATGCDARSADSSSLVSQPPAAAAGSAAAPAQAAPVQSEIEVPFPLPVIELAGTDAQIGAEHGRRLGDTIRSLHANYLKSYFANPGQRVLAMAAAAAFEPRFSPEHLAEVRALAKETGIEPRQMLLAQCFLDLSAMTACSTVALPPEASPDGVARFGRNLDFPSFDIADKATVVLVFKPQDGRYAFAAVGWPGMCGVLSGMNEHGLTLANMEVTRSRRLPTAMPYVLLYRTLLERCRTVDEAVALLEKTPRQSANNLMLMDAAGNRAVAEITPEAVVVRRGVAGEALFSTNHQRGDDRATPGLCPRYDSLHDASARRFGKIDVKAIETMLAAASQKKLTLQSMVFEPSNRVIYLSAGADAARRPFYKLDLKPKFAMTRGAPAAI